jgi:hypothetical protein
MARTSLARQKQVTLRPGARLKLGAMGEIEMSDDSNQPTMMHSSAGRKKVDSDGGERDECSSKKKKIIGHQNSHMAQFSIYRTWFIGKCSST